MLSPLQARMKMGIMSSGADFYKCDMPTLVHCWHLEEKKKKKKKKKKKSPRVMKM